MYIASGTKDAQLDISPAKPLNGQKIWTQCYKGVMYCNSTIAAIERSPLNDIKESSEADKRRCWRRRGSSARSTTGC